MKFTATPEEINYSTRRSPDDLINTIIPHLENEAIKILIDAGICPEIYYNPPGPSDTESWRAFWLNEAIHQCDDFDPVGSSGEHLDQAQRAAVNVLISASCLREFIEHENAGKAAAMAMILVSDAIIGGLSIDLAKTSESLSKSVNAKRYAYESGLGKRQSVFYKMKDFCLKFAAEKWEAEPNISMGNMANAAIDKLRSTIGTGKAAGDIPGAETVTVWLRSAGKAGTIKVPAEASKPGRPRKSNK